MANTALTPVEFHGVSLFVTIINSVPFVVLRQIVEALGLDWAAQFTRIKRHPVLSSTVVVTTTVAEDGKQREMVMLSLDKLDGWLFGVQVGRVKPELRPRLIQYQRECFDVLAKHFSAQQPSIPRQLPNALRQITPPAAPELPAIDVRELLLSGQSDPLPLTAAQQALVDDQAWRMAGEAYQLCREHIARAIAYQTVQHERTNPKNPRIASIVKGITLSTALAHAYWAEIRSLRSIAQSAIYVAQNNLEHINAALAGQPKPKDMLY